MKNILFLLSVCFLISLLASSETQSQEAAKTDPKIYLQAISTAELKAKEGQRVVVYGETTGSGKSSSGTNFVNFKGAEFYLVTFKSDLSAFADGEPADAYDGKRIAVEGVISIHKEKPQIKLDDPKMVTILKEGEEFPPKKAASSEEATAKTKAAEKQGGREDKAKPDEKAKRTPPVDPKKYFK